MPLWALTKFTLIIFPYLLFMYFIFCRYGTLSKDPEPPHSAQYTLSIMRFQLNEKMEDLRYDYAFQLPSPGARVTVLKQLLIKIRSGCIRRGCIWVRIVGQLADNMWLVKCLPKRHEVLYWGPSCSKSVIEVNLIVVQHSVGCTARSDEISIAPNIDRSIYIA